VMTLVTKLVVGLARRTEVRDCSTVEAGDEIA
jgi:hypothetical protein